MLSKHDSGDQSTSKIVPPSTMGIAEEQRIQTAVASARARAFGHVDAQHSMPAEILPHLIAVEVQYWVTNGEVLPVVTLDNGTQQLLAPADKEILPFLRDCFIRFAKESLACTYMTADIVDEVVTATGLVVVLLTKRRELVATCEITHSNGGPILGDWKIVPPRKSGCNQAFTASEDRQRIGRNQPRPCGSAEV